MIARSLTVLLLAGGLHAAPAPDWVRLAMLQTVHPQSPGTAAVVLSDITTLTFAPSGELTTQRRRVVKVLSPAGRDYTFGMAAFDDKTKLLALRGWSINPQGSVQKLRERDAVEITAVTDEVFTDTKVKFLDMPSEVGSVIAYEYQTRGRPYEPASVWQFQESIPVLHARLEARLPEGWTYEAKWTNHAPVEPASGPAWDLRDIPAIADEPRMPDEAAVAGRMGVHWNGSRSWNDIGTWFHGLAAPRFAPTPALQAKARELTREPADPVQALARFTQRDVRYVAVAIGIGGYQPHSAGDVFANRYGDCKDKATLLRTMLASLGVESHFVLVHTTRGMVEPSFPTVLAFNHVISAIRIPRERAKGVDAVIEHPRLGTLLLFDPTSTTTKFGQLPSYLQASRGLLVTAEGADLIELPSHAPEASTLRRTARLQLDEGGTLHGSVEEVRSGAIAAAMRDRLQPLNATERVRVIESSLAHHLAQQTITGVKIDNLDDPETDLVVRYTIAAPGYATRVAGMLLVRPRVLGTKGESPVAIAGRMHGYVMDGPSLHTDDVEIVLPASAELDELPNPVTLSTQHVQYASSSAFENGVLRYSRKYVPRTYTVDREAIGVLNDAFAKIAADERASAVFKWP